MKEILLQTLKKIFLLFLTLILLILFLFYLLKKENYLDFKNQEEAKTKSIKFLKNLKEKTSKYKK